MGGQAGLFDLADRYALLSENGAPLERLSDEQAEFQVRDRLSFMRFLGLTLSDPVPDRTTIWLFAKRW